MGVMDEVMGITDAKTRLPEIIRRFKAGTADQVFIVRNNKPVAVIVSVDAYDVIRRILAREQAPPGVGVEESEPPPTPGVNPVNPDP